MAWMAMPEAILVDDVANICEQPFASLPERKDFMRLTKSSRRRSGAGVAVQATERPDRSEGVRVGFTVSKKVHKRAVIRNRVKRRLREIVRRHARALLLPGTDYVLVARREAIDMPFAALTDEVLRVLKRLG